MSDLRVPACGLAALAAALLTWAGSGDSAAQTAATAAERQPEAQREPAPPRTDAEQRRLSAFMRAKLAASNQILEGLCVEDFDLIAKGAKELGRVSSAEQWRISNDAIYRQHSAEFSRVVQDLEKSAADKSLEGASLRWMEATLGCIECHRFVRAMMIAGER